MTDDEIEMDSVRMHTILNTIRWLILKYDKRKYLGLTDFNIDFTLAWLLQDRPELYETDMMFKDDYEERFKSVFLNNYIYKKSDDDFYKNVSVAHDEADRNRLMTDSAQRGKTIFKLYLKFGSPKYGSSKKYEKFKAAVNNALY